MGIKISNLPPATTPLTGSELVPVVQGGVTAKAAVSTMLSGSSGSASVGFLQSGTGAVARTLQAKGRDSVNVADFGAVGDGVTNDTAAINAAITAVRAAGGGTVFFSAKNYKVTTINLYSGIYLQGQGAQKRSDKPMTLLTGTAGYNVIEIDPGFSTDIAIRHLGTYGGNRSVSYDPTISGTALINFEMYDVTLGFPTNECIFIGGQAERLRFSFVNFNNGTYGYYHGIGLTGRPFALFEKSTWEHIYMEGQSINGIFYDNTNVSGSTSYTFMKINTTGRESIRFKGNVGGLTFTDLLFENTATSSPTPANTTGNMTAGSPNLTVASGTNFVNGQQVTVSGAGLMNGYLAYADLEATIVSGGGTVNLVLSKNADYSVTGAPVTNRRYDTIKFEGGTGTNSGAGISSNINFIGCYLDGGYGTAPSPRARYVLNTNGVVLLNLIGTVGQAGGLGGSAFGVPIYDPTGQVSFFNGSGGVRTIKAPGQTRPTSVYFVGGISSFPQGNYLGVPSVVEYPPSIISAPPGQSIITTLMASDVAGAPGAFWGNFEIFIKDPNYNSIFQIAGKNGITDAKLSIGTRLGLPQFGGGGSYSTYSSAELMVSDAIPTVGSWPTGGVILRQNPAVGEPWGWQCRSGGTPGTWVTLGYLNEGQVTFGTAPPSTGAWYQGSICFNRNAAVGQISGWQCTVGGTPGTWTPLGYVYDQKIMFANDIPSTSLPTTTFARGSVVFNSVAAVGVAKGWQCTVAGTPGTWVSMGNL